VWSDLARRLAACALTGRDHAELIPLNTCYVAAVPTEEEAERLTAWLNSTWVRAIAQLHAVPASGGFHRFTAPWCDACPYPPRCSPTTDCSRPREPLAAVRP
jgi:hypothetical protein